jgi:two-component system chemotaxis response regulator CheY
MKILIVDDSKAMRAIIGRLVRKLGHETVEAAHGREALEKLNAESGIELALVDWNMPYVNGVELVKAVRSTRHLASLPMLMVTSEAEVGRIQVALEAGADEYLMKPFTDEQLVSKIAMAVSARGEKR